jgi:hypothetical protein
MVSSSLLSFSSLNAAYASDSLETILSHLSTRVMDIIADGICLQHLDFLLEFLAAWGKRPACLTLMAYQWCSAISEAAGKLGLNELPADQPSTQQLQSFSRRLRFRIRFRLRLPPQDMAHPDSFSEIAEGEFSVVGPGCDSVRMDNASNQTHLCPQDLIPFHYARLLPVILEIGFRLAGPGHDGSAPHLNHTSHHLRVYEAAFSSDADDIIADAVSVWIVGGDCPPPGLLVRYFAKRVERRTPFSPRLRRVAICAIEPIWRSELEVSGLEVVHLLARLNVDVDDMVEKHIWVRLLIGVICLPVGLVNLSHHYWYLLDKLALGEDFSWAPGLRSVEVMRSLGEAKDWEKLEVWMMVIWQSLSHSTPAPRMEDVERVTLKLLLQRPSTLLRFETLYERGSLVASHKTKLQQMCDRARAERLSFGSPPPRYVSVRPAQHLHVLIPPFYLLQSIDSRSITCLPSFCGRRHFLRLFVVQCIESQDVCDFFWNIRNPCHI